MTPGEKVAQPRTSRRVGWVLVLLAVAAASLVAVQVSLPDVEPLRHEQPDHTSYMRYRARQVGLPEDAYRLDWVTLEGISPVLLCAAVKAEDRGFFRHDGFEWSQIRRAAWLRIRGQSRMGGSTISQQVARNLFLTPRRSVWRKVREALITRDLEKALTKREIIEIYLNIIEWGDGVWGIGQASQHYFRVHPSRLGAFESAFLASIIAAPRQRLTGTNQVRAQRTMHRVLGQMYVSGIIDWQEWQRARVQSARLFDGLRAGVPVHLLIGGEPALEGAAPERELDRVPLSQVLAQECGFEQELSR